MDETPENLEVQNEQLVIITGEINNASISRDYLSSFSNLLNILSYSISRESGQKFIDSNTDQIENQWKDCCDNLEKMESDLAINKNESDVWGVIEENKNDNAKIIYNTEQKKTDSFITKSINQRRMVSFDYSCKRRNSSFRQFELLTPIKKEKWDKNYEIKFDFLQDNFSEVLQRILYNVVRKRVSDPVHYIVHYLIKYKVYKSMNAKINKHWF